MFLTDETPDEPPITLAITAGDQQVVLETADGGVRPRPGTTADADASITGSPWAVLRLTGKLSLAEARERGLEYRGPAKALRRIQPAVPVG